MEKPILLSTYIYYYKDTAIPSHGELLHSRKRESVVGTLLCKFENNPCATDSRVTATFSRCRCLPGHSNELRFGPHLGPSLLRRLHLVAAWTHASDEHIAARTGAARHLRCKTRQGSAPHTRATLLAHAAVISARVRLLHRQPHARQCGTGRLGQLLKPSMGTMAPAASARSTASWRVSPSVPVNATRNSARDACLDGSASAPAAGGDPCLSLLNPCSSSSRSRVRRRLRRSCSRNSSCSRRSCAVRSAKNASSVGRYSRNRRRVASSGRRLAIPTTCVGGATRVRALPQTPCLGRGVRHAARRQSHTVCV